MKAQNSRQSRYFQLIFIVGLAIGLTIGVVSLAAGMTPDTDAPVGQTVPPPPPPKFVSPYGEGGRTTTEGPAAAFTPSRAEWLYRAETGVPVANSNNGAEMAFPSAARLSPAAPDLVDILVYADDFVHTATNTYPDLALNYLGLGYTAHYDSDFTGFETSLTTGNWGLVIFAVDNNSPPSSVLDALNTYVLNGGRLIVHNWALSSSSAHPLWTTLGVSFVSNDSPPPDPVYWWADDHPTFNSPLIVPEFISLTVAGAGIYGQRVNPLPGFQSLAGFTSIQAISETAIIQGNNNRTIFRGFIDAQQDADLDNDMLPDGVELWINQISSMLVSHHYVAATWSDNAVHFLDFDLYNQGAFTATAAIPNAVATDGELIFTGHFGSQEVIAYNLDGVEQYRWSAPLAGLQGMDLVDGDLAIYRGVGPGVIEFYNPTTGALIRSIPGAPAGFIEGLAYDGTLLWQLGASIYGTNPLTGSVVMTITNAASGCNFNGTGITASAPGRLTLACDDGTWYHVSSTDGSVLNTGNNGLDMYGLKSLPFADLALTMVDNPDPVLVGDSVFYTLTIQNNGLAEATGVLLVDTLPPGMRFVAASPSCSHMMGEVVCTVGDLINGGVVEIVIEAEALEVTGGFLNGARVSSEVNDPLPGNNTATEQTLIIADFIPHACSAPTNPVLNCSFETGSFAFWGTASLTDTYYTFTVGGAGLRPNPLDIDAFLSAPTDGSYAALHGFDGEGPGLIQIYQDIEVPLGASNLIFDYRVAWDLITYAPPGTIDRLFRVRLEPLYAGPPAQTTPILVATAGTHITDTTDMTGIVDISGFAGSGARVVFEWEVPQDYTGPAWFQLDNIMVVYDPPIIDVDPPVIIQQQVLNHIDQRTLDIHNLGGSNLSWDFVTTPFVPAAASSAAAISSGHAPQIQPAQEGPSWQNPEVQFEADPVRDRKFSLAPDQVDDYTFYTSRLDFDNAFPGLTLEDFEAGQAITGSITTCSGPIDHRIANQCFTKRGLLPGITLEDIPPGLELVEFVVLGAGYLGLPTTSKTVGPNNFIDSTDVRFGYYDVYEVGFDLFSGVPITDVMEVTVYGPMGVLSSVYTMTAANTGTFFGVTSDDPIRRIQIDSVSGGGELIDNLAFTSAPCDPIPWVSIDPITGTLAAGATQPVDLTFDSTGIAHGTYTGNLCVLNNSLDTPMVIIPLTFQVDVPVYLPYISKD